MKRTKVGVTPEKRQYGNLNHDDIELVLGSCEHLDWF